jgi:circadian clock protein KaiC
MIERGTLCITHVEPLQLSPDEFACIVRDEVEGRNTRIVMIDSIAGYRLAIAGENVVPHIYALNRYLRNMGVTAIMSSEIENITGDFRVTEDGFSYLMDNIIFIRYVEAHSELRRVIGVLKKRVSGFEKTMREMEITSSGVRLGGPLREMQGVLRGIPEILGMPPLQNEHAGRREAA